MAAGVFNVVRLIRFPSRGSGARLGADALRFFADGLRLIDIAVLLLGAYAALLAAAQPVRDVLKSEYAHTALIAGIFLPLVLEKTGAYGTRILDQLAAQCRRAALGCAILFGGLLAIGFGTGTLDYVERLWVLAWLAITTTGMVVARAGLGLCIRRLKAEGHLRERIAIVGSGPWGNRLFAHLTHQHDTPVEIVGIFDARMTRTSSKHRPPDGTLEDLLALGRDRQIDKIVIALPWSAEERVLEIIHTLKELSIDIALSPDQIGFSLMNRPVDYLGELPLMRVVDRPLSQWRYVAKLVEDKLLASVALVVLAPLMLAVAVAIRLESPGPVLFRQKRHGFNNTEFEVFKFRSMKTDQGDATGARQTARNDPRVTRLGSFLRKSSIDELPQLFNVLLGDMSIVGPRPHPIGMRTGNRLCEDLVDEYAHRHRVRPGITGWAQVNGYRGATETAAQLQRRVELDLHYIDNWSIVLDLKIILLTVLAVLGRKNAF